MLRAAVNRPPLSLPRPAGFVDAAVLLPVFEGRLLLTVRSAHLPHHAAQISFPGGRLGPGENPSQAALREAWEEVGLDPHLVEILGPLDPTLSPHGYRVFPLLGWVTATPHLRPNPKEVESLLWVPIEELLQAPAYAEERSLPLPHSSAPRQVWHYPWQGYDIWGVTGNILHDFLERLRALSSGWPD
ncbi:CoA pyrophosphatase [Meiothermus sp. QL-1]|uniref:NUDIX hydrolase n=1 Tax=Meiothermus sp. QL-1 TaxID=2058095 RepID=UPI001F1975D9|nr:CoA pyrophosphatase [Meiothermus sp. QL-1]